MWRYRSFQLFPLGTGNAISRGTGVTGSLECRASATVMAAKGNSPA